MTKKRSQMKVVHHTRHLRDYVGSLKTLIDSGELDDIRKTAMGFRASLQEHFEGEELPGGWFAEVENVAPRLAPTIKRLRQDHQDLLRALDLICNDPFVDKAGAVTGIQKCLDLYSEHEVAEDRIINEVFYTDHGYPS